jgi:hypothetical protein
MKKSMLSVLAVCLFVSMGAVYVAAQEAGKPATQAGEKAQPTAAPERRAKGAFGKAETISGTISIVDKDKKLIVLAGSGGVPYNFKVTRSTRINIGGKKVKLDDLAGQTNKQASIKFLPLRTGNAAQSVEVSP